MEKVRYVKARAIDWILVFTAVAAIAAIIDLGVSVYNARYSVNVEAAKTLELEYSKSSSQSAINTIEMAKGTLYYGWAQMKGNEKCKYTLSYKKTSSSSYKTVSTNYSFPKNKTYYGEYKIKKVNGRADYNIRCKKTAGKSKKSKIRIDFMIL